MTDCPKCEGTGTQRGYQWQTKAHYEHTCSHCLGTGTAAALFKYAGIGSRETPGHIASFMTAFAMSAALKGCVLRSGAGKRPAEPKPDTDSADLAFERGCDLVRGRKVIRTPTYHQSALDHAAQFHPAWDRCSEWARAAHARNSLIVLGDWLDDPVQFVVCYTDGGQIKGGTGQGIRVAMAHNIPVYNLAIPSHLAAMQEWIK